MTGHERNIIDNEFSDMEVIDSKKSIKHDYKNKYTCLHITAFF